MMRTYNKDNYYYHARWEHAWLLRAEGLTFSEIAKHFGVTTERARQMISQFSFLAKNATRKTRFYIQ